MCLLRSLQGEARLSCSLDGLAALGSMTASLDERQVNVTGEGGENPRERLFVLVIPAPPNRNNR